MPAKSKDQFRFMQGVLSGSIPAPKGLSKAEATDFVKGVDYKKLPKKKRFKKLLE
jgi:hypothetical protein